MINASYEVENWEMDSEGFRVSPGVGWCLKGNRVKIGEGVRLGNWVTLGDGVIIPENTTFARDLGIQSGYRHVLIIQNGEWKFVGGCHVFTFSEAREYWRGKPNRVETLAAVDFAETLAKLITFNE